MAGRAVGRGCFIFDHPGGARARLGAWGEEGALGSAILNRAGARPSRAFGAHGAEVLSNKASRHIIAAGQVKRFLDPAIQYTLKGHKLRSNARRGKR